MKDMDSSLANYHMMQGSKYLKTLKCLTTITSQDNLEKLVLLYVENLQHLNTVSWLQLSQLNLAQQEILGIPIERQVVHGGAASAVSSRIVPIAHASDGGGSIRIPAASCGLVGLKPNRARTSFAPSHGDKWGGLTHSGIVSRTVRDTAYMYDCLFGNVVGDPYGIPYKKGSLVEALSKK